VYVCNYRERKAAEEEARAAEEKRKAAEEAAEEPELIRIEIEQQHIDDIKWLYWADIATGDKVKYANECRVGVRRLS